MRKCQTTLDWNSVEWNPMQWTRRDPIATAEYAWIGLESVRMNWFPWLCHRHAPSLSLSEIVTSSRKWRPLECNQNYHRLEFDRNQHHMECDGNYCQTSGQKVSTKVRNVWTFSNFSDIKCFRLNMTSELQKCASGWSGINLWIAGFSGTTLISLLALSVKDI